MSCCAHCSCRPCMCGQRAYNGEGFDWRVVDRAIKRADENFKKEDSRKTNRRSSKS